MMNAASAIRMTARESSECSSTLKALDEAGMCNLSMRFMGLADFYLSSSYRNDLRLSARINDPLQMPRPLVERSPLFVQEVIPLIVLSLNAAGASVGQ